MTVTAVRPNQGLELEIENNNVKSFSEKPINEGGWINGGFVLNKRLFN